MARIVLGLMLLAACRSGGSDRRIPAASTLHQRYADSQFAKWEMHIRAAGADCGVLLVETNGIALDDALVAAVHRGVGPYAIDGRGMERFSEELQFRGVVYRDPTQRTWWRGGVDSGEVLAPCH